MTSSIGNIFRITALCEGNPPVTNGFPSQSRVMWSFDVLCDLHLNKQLRESSSHRWFPLTKASDVELWCFCDLRLNKQLSKQSRCLWFETASCSLWCQYNEMFCTQMVLRHQKAQCWLSDPLRHVFCTIDNDVDQNGQQERKSPGTLEWQHIEAETRWPTFSRRHFQMHFLEWKCINIP